MKNTPCLLGISRLLSRILLSALLSGAIIFSANATDVASYGIFKNQSFTQNDVGQPQAQALGYDFFTEVRPQGVFNGQITNPRLTLPGGISHALDLPPFGSPLAAGWGTGAATLAELRPRKSFSVKAARWSG